MIFKNTVPTDGNSSVLIVSDIGGNRHSELGVSNNLYSFVLLTLQSIEIRLVGVSPSVGDQINS